MIITVMTPKVEFIVYGWIDVLDFMTVVETRYRVIKIYGSYPTLTVEFKN